MSFLQWQHKNLADGKKERYAYMASSQWNAQKKRSEQKRLYIGRLDTTETHIIISKRFAGNENIVVSIHDVENAVKDERGFELWLRNTCLDLSKNTTENHDKISCVHVVGDYHALIALSNDIGLTETLVNIFGATEGHALLGLAMHQVVTGHALYRAQDWLEQRAIPSAMKSRLTSPGNVYDMMAQIGADLTRRELFLKTWITRHGDIEILVFDTTSISTYSPHLESAEWGYNRDDERLEQINFSLAVHAKTSFPVYYRVIPGSIPDVKTLHNSLEFMEELGMDIHAIALDRGFYSATNVRDILQRHVRVIIGVPWTSLQAQHILKKNKHKLDTPKRSVHYHGMMLRHIMVPWTVKMGKNHQSKTIHAHLFLDQNKRTALVSHFEKTVFTLIEQADQEIFKTASEARSWVGEHGGKYKKCLTVKSISTDHFRVTRQPNNVATLTRRMGYFLILTSGGEADAEDPVNVLENYRARDKVEKLYDCLKNEDGQHRLRTGNDSSAQGRFFLNFIALILRSELDKKMRTSKLRNRMTTARLLDELGKIKSVTTTSGKDILLEITKKQRELISSLEVEMIT